MPERFANEAQTTLTAPLLAGVNAMAVADPAEFPLEGNFRVRVETSSGDHEFIIVTQVNGSVFGGLVRGAEDTEDLDHSAGSKVTMVLTAGALEAALDERAPIENPNFLGGLSIDGTDLLDYIPEPVPGPPGPSLQTYRHDQSMPVSEVLIKHDLGRYPNVLVIDSAGSEIEGAYSYPDSNHVLVSFSGPFSFTVHLS